MNEVIRAIEERRSVRAYTDEMPRASWWSRWSRPASGRRAA